MIHVKIRINPYDKETPFLMRVIGVEHRDDFSERFATQNEVWQAAREVSEKEQDYRVKTGPGW